MGISLSSYPRVPIYNTADATARNALTSMQTGDLCLQLDTNQWYSYNSSSWDEIAESAIELKETITLGSSGTFDFTGLSGDSDQSYILVIKTASQASQSVDLRFNNDSGAKYSWSNNVNGVGTTGANQNEMQLFDNGGTPFENFITANISPIRDSYVNVSSVGSRGNLGTPYSSHAGGVYDPSAEITSIQIISTDTNTTFLTGSTASLYKLKN